MKSSVIVSGLLAVFASASVMADASSDLQQRLDKVKSFHATFSQKVTDGGGASVQDGEGEMWVQRQFRIGYNRAARIIEQMEAQGIVSSPGHNGNREVLAPPPHER